MDKNTKMHAEYRVEYRHRGLNEWHPFSTDVFTSVDQARRHLATGEGLGFELRIAVRLVGDWCEMNEGNK